MSMVHNASRWSGRPSFCDMSRRPDTHERAVRMPGNSEPARIPDERLSIEQRTDGTLVIRVQSEDHRGGRLPDAKFSFRCGDPQYAYWLSRFQSRKQAFSTDT